MIFRAPPKSFLVAEYAPHIVASASKILTIALLFLRFLNPYLRHDARTLLGPRFPGGTLKDVGMLMLQRTGRVIIESILTAGRSSVLFFVACWQMRYLRRSFRTVLQQIELAGFGSLMVLSLIAALTGMIMVMQIGPTLEQFGALETLGGIIGAAFTREFGPIWAAIIILARVGSAMAAELGTMVVNEEVEALRVMSINPVRYLVMPRIFTLMLIMPMLTIIADLVGLLGGSLVANSLLGQHPSIFFNSAQTFLDWQSVWSGLIKSVFFGAIIGAIACDQGLHAKGGAEGVGHATTTTVRLCVIFVLIADLVLTAGLRVVLQMEG